MLVLKGTFYKNNKQEWTDRLPALNDYISAERSNRYAGAKMKSTVQGKIGWCVYQQMRDVHYQSPVYITFKWYERNARRDVDNIAFAKKFILDALVENGVIANDDQKHVKGFKDEFYIDNLNPRIEVEFKEI